MRPLSVSVRSLKIMALALLLRGGVHQTYGADHNAKFKTVDSFDSFVLKDNNAKNLVLLDYDFEVNVYDDGDVDVNFYISNTNKYLRAHFSLAFDFFADKNRTEFITQSETMQFMNKEDTSDKHIYTLKLAPKDAQRVKSFSVSIKEHLFHENGLINAVYQNRVTITIVCLALILGGLAYPAVRLIKRILNKKNKPTTP